MPDPATIATIALSAQKILADQGNQRRQFDAANRRNLFSVFQGPRADARLAGSLQNTGVDTLQKGVGAVVNQQQQNAEAERRAKAAQANLDFRQQQADRQDELARLYLQQQNPQLQGPPVAFSTLGQAQAPTAAAAPAVVPTIVPSNFNTFAGAGVPARTNGGEFL